MLRKAVTGLTLSSVLTLGIVACGGGSAPSAAGTVLTAEAITGVTFTQNFNPFSAASLSAEMNMRTLVYEPLIEFDALQPGILHPWLASSWRWSNGGKTLTVHLRRGVNWSDGQALTSADVAYTFNLVNKVAAANYNGFPPLSGAPTTPDAATVVLNWSSPQYANLYAIAGSTYIVPAHIWQSIIDPATATVQATQTLESIVSSQLPVIPLLYGADWNEYSTAKFTGWPSPGDPYMDPSPSDPQLPYILMHLRPVS